MRIKNKRSSFVWILIWKEISYTLTGIQIRKRERERESESNELSKQSFIKFYKLVTRMSLKIV